MKTNKKQLTLELEYPSCSHCKYQLIHPISSHISFACLRTSVLRDFYWLWTVVRGGQYSTSTPAEWMVSLLLPFNGDKIEKDNFELRCRSSPLEKGERRPSGSLPNRPNPPISLKALSKSNWTLQLENKVWCMGVFVFF